MLARQVSVINNNGKWSGTITEDSLLGLMTTLDIEAPSEDAVMQGIIAGLGGVRIHVGRGR
jgi:hypothetical protein